MKFKQYITEKAKKKLIAYHGSYDPNIKNFSTKRRRSETNTRLLGAYFTDNPKLALTFGDNLYKVKLKFKKLIDLTKWKAQHADEEFIEAIPELKDEEIEYYLQWSYYGHDSAYHVIETFDEKYNILKRWKKKGYDGIAFMEYHFSEIGITYIPFNVNQIEIIE